jgi:hypothetical protein
MSRDSAALPPSSAPRRLRYGLSTAIILLAVTASCVIAGALATRWSLRIDVTATREHTLAPRTLALLRALGEPVEIVITADFATLDPRATLRLRDVLDGLERATDRLTVTEIDLGGAGGRASFESLLERLATTLRPRAAEHAGALEEAIATTHTAVLGLNTISTELLLQRATLSAQSPEAQNLDRIAAATRLLAGSIGEALAGAEKALHETIGPAQLPSIDSAAVAVASMHKALLVDLDSLDRALSSVSLSMPDGVDLGDAADTLMALRDAIARAQDAVDRLKPIQSLAAVRTIESGPGAVVIAGDRARAIPMRALFPPSSLIDSASTGAADLRFVGESLLSAAIGSLTGARSAPIVVLVHGAAERQLDDQGRALTPDADRAFGTLLESLRLRDLRIAEWAPGAGSPRPTFSGTPDAQARPVVWATFPVTVRSSAGAERMGRYAGAIEGLLESGANVLFSFDASTLPGIGEQDPMAAPLRPLGISVRTGAAMLRRQNTPGGPVVDGQFVLRSADHANPIGVAIDGLATRLAWPCPIEIAPAPGVTTWPILTIPRSETVWGELEWFAFRSLTPAQRAMLADAPKPDAGVDLIGGPWTVAMAAERSAPGGESRTQRLVVVGANGWFTDAVTRDSSTIDGRTITATPGNAELFDASVAWLAHQDDTIAAGPGSNESSRIPPMDIARLTALRWGIIAGMPLLALLIGVVLRLWRG